MLVRSEGAMMQAYEAGTVMKCLLCGTFSVVICDAHDFGPDLDLNSGEVQAWYVLWCDAPILLVLRNSSVRIIPITVNAKNSHTGYKLSRIVRDLILFLSARVPDAKKYVQV